MNGEAKKIRMETVGIICSECENRFYGEHWMLKEDNWVLRFCSRECLRSHKGGTQE